LIGANPNTQLLANEAATRVGIDAHDIGNFPRLKPNHRALDKNSPHWHRCQQGQKHAACQRRHGGSSSIGCHRVGYGIEPSALRDPNDKTVIFVIQPLDPSSNVLKLPTFSIRH
jgi:hypothetical protein